MEQMYGQAIDNSRNLLRTNVDSLHIVYSTREAPTILLLHGAFASAFPFLKLADQLAESYRVLLPDMPGWGISPANIKNTDDIIQWHIKFLHDLICSMTPEKKCIIVAHSLGGFWAVHFARAHPECVDRLILVSPAGLFSVNSSVGMIWGIMFYYILPWANFLLKAFSCVITCFAKYISNAVWQFSLHQWSSNIPFAFMLRAFVKFEGTSMYWRVPCITEFSQLQVPVALIHGAFDSLCPAHHGRFVFEISDGKVPCYSLETGHAPHRDSKFFHLLNCAIESATIPSQHITFSKEIPLFRAFWSRAKTKQQIREMYSKLRKKMN
jgi:pimeloyl-ACP methyl ester carboxylesterase